MINAIFVLSDPKSGSDEALGRVFNALAAAFEYKQAGDEVTVTFQGAGTRWAAELSKAERIVRSGPRGTHLYVCGSHSLLEAAPDAAHVAGPPRARIHFESFGYRRQASDRPFTLEQTLTGMTLTVEPSQSLLATMEAAGVWVPSDCRRGECGTCVTTIARGEVSHRDVCLTADQRKSTLCTCVSWAAGPHLALER